MPAPTTDLTQRPPRSPRVRLGGYVILPRILDKCRAVLAGKNGEFNYNCPLDQNFLTFAGIDPDQLKVEVAKGKCDGEILEWVSANAKTKPNTVQIAAWSVHQEQRGPTDLEMRKFFNDYHSKMAPQRKDVATWFDILDIDDYVTFGGRP